MSVQENRGKGRVPPESALPRAVKIYRGLSDPLAFLSGLEAQFGDIVTLRRGHSYAIFHPDYIKRVLQDNHPNYGKGERYRAALAPLMGNGLFTSEGQFWLRQRRLAQVAFQRAHLASFAAPITIHVSDLVAKWHNKAKSGTPVALREELTDLTLRIALRNLFSADAEKHIAALVEAAFCVNDINS